MSYVEESVNIDIDPNAVYTMVIDMARMGDWSPENVGGRWLDGATGLVVGARFQGDNRRGLRGANSKGVLRWHTVSTVSAVDPGRQFAFTVVFLGTEISEWRYSFEETARGCKVTERWTDRRSDRNRRIDDAYVRYALRTKDRGEWNRQNIRTTLTNLKSRAESPRS